MDDLIIINGRVVDGSGREAYRADVAVKGDRIRKIAPQIEPREGACTIDAAGLCVCPGFIDIHSHTDFTIRTNPRAESKVRQGITTEVVGNCGFSAGPVRPEHFEDLLDYLMNTAALTEEERQRWRWESQGAFMEEVAGQGTAVNLVPLVGHGTLRVAVMGFARRPPTREELDAMAGLLGEDLDGGIFGLSTGLQYDPGSFAGREELLALAAVAASRDALYATHLQSEGTRLLECLDQAVKIGEKSGVSVQVSHLKAENPDNWGKAEKALDLLDRARESGVPVDFDVYPYTAFGSSLFDLLPPWARERGARHMTGILQSREGRRRVLEDMAKDTLGDWHNPMRKTPWERVRIAAVRSEKNRVFEGLNLEEAAKLCRLSPAETVVELLAREEGGVKMVFFGMHEEDVTRIMRHPRAIFCTDGRAAAPYGPLAAGKVHPRYYGAFPRILGLFVRERKVLSLEEAVKKMTMLPARKLNLKGRGLLREGNFADITLIDPETVEDKATFADPHRYPRGIPHVIVNGRVVVAAGEHRGSLPGRVLNRLRDTGFTYEPKEGNG